MKFMKLNDHLTHLWFLDFTWMPESTVKGQRTPWHGSAKIDQKKSTPWMWGERVGIIGVVDWMLLTSACFFFSCGRCKPEWIGNEEWGVPTREITLNTLHPPIPLTCVFFLKARTLIGICPVFFTIIPLVLTRGDVAKLFQNAYGLQLLAPYHVVALAMPEWHPWRKPWAISKS